MAKSGLNRSIDIPQPNIWGRIGTGFGQGLGEQFVKEVERGRLSSHLNNLGKQQGLTPFQQYTGLLTAPGITPQGIQGGSDLLRQQAILNSIQQGNQPPPPPNTSQNANVNQEGGPVSITTTKGNYSKQNPYVPPSGQEQENEARKLWAEEPLVYRSLDEARNAIQNRISGDVNKSNAQIASENLKEGIQTKTESELNNQIQKYNAIIPARPLVKLEQKALDLVRFNKMSPEAAKVEIGKEADAISRDFNNIRSWGGISLPLTDKKDLKSSINSLQKNAREKGYQKDAADTMIASNDVTPEFAYASMYPVKDIKPLNEEIKKLKTIPTQFNPVTPGVSHVSQNEEAIKQTKRLAPRLANLMGSEGSPLSIAYELEKKNYDPATWKEFLVENQGILNLTSDQKDELQKTQPSFYGQLNDWWFKSFTGVE